MRIQLTVYPPGKEPATAYQQASNDIDVALVQAEDCIKEEARKFVMSLRHILHPALVARGREPHEFQPKLRIVPTEWGFDLVDDELGMLIMRLMLVDETT